MRVNESKQAHIKFTIAWFFIFLCGCWYIVNTVIYSCKKIMLFVKLIQFASIFCATTLLNQSIVNLLKRKHQKMYLEYICKLIWKVLSAISFEQNKTYITVLLELGMLGFFKVAIVPVKYITKMNYTWDILK